MLGMQWLLSRCLHYTWCLPGHASVKQAPKPCYQRLFDPLMDLPLYNGFRSLQRAQRPAWPCCSRLLSDVYRSTCLAACRASKAVSECMDNTVQDAAR